MNDPTEVLQNSNNREQSSAESQTQLPDAHEPSSRIEVAAGGPVPFAVGGKKGAAKRAVHAILRCKCFHAKSIHSRMYANRALGTSCNFPGCRCKAYRPAKATSRKKSGR